MMGKRKLDKGSRSRPNSNERHPSHLKGREIGLFYAQKGKAKKEVLRKRPLGTVLLSPSKRERIQTELSSTEFRNLFVTDDGSYDHVKDSDFKREFLRTINESIDEKLEQTPMDTQANAQLDEEFFQEYSWKQKGLKFIEMMEKRKKLPTFKMRDEILKIINENEIVVISGETGCGKTTQVAQFILDDFLEKGKGSECRVLCTQPRRISAISVAQRVADERTEVLGLSVGYQIRMEKKLPRERGCINFCTTGVVLKMMESDPALSSVSHLILDEIHERDVLSDFVLALIKKIKTRRKDLKIILMSATLNAEKFSKYYNDCPHINIPGFTYPVQEYYLEDVLMRTGFRFEVKRIPNRKAKPYIEMIEPHIRNLERSKQYNKMVCDQLRNPLCEEVNLELILALLVNICQKEKDEGAILIFLTGFAEISNLLKLIGESRLFPPTKYQIYPLHSMLPTLEQRQIFETPPKGIRKIIVATNIAETSITIDDVVFVIDCGKIKMTNFDAKNNSDILAPEWVSMANASQRKGRAGRVQPGICFHLFSKARQMVLEQYQLPEILRTRLEDVILNAKILQLGQIVPFFLSLIDPPNPETVGMALHLLKRLNALTEDEKLTPLGYHLAKLPIAPQMGKMILFGAIFSCLDPILSIAATLDYKDPFQLPIGQERAVNTVKLDLSNGMNSDHLLFHEALHNFETSVNTRKFCWDNFLSQQTLLQLQTMRKQFMQYLHEMNFVCSLDSKAPDANRNSKNMSLVKAIICAGLYPNIAIAKNRGKMPSVTPDFHRLSIHPKSILSLCQNPESNILVYYRKVNDSIHDCSFVHPLPVIFFGDKFELCYHEGRNTIKINDNMRFECSESTSGIIKELRDRFNWFLEYKISHPGPVVWTRDSVYVKSNETKILELIVELITCEEMEVYDDDTFEDYD